MCSKFDLYKKIRLSFGRGNEVAFLDFFNVSVLETFINQSVQDNSICSKEKEAVSPQMPVRTTGTREGRNI